MKLTMTGEGIQAGLGNFSHPQHGYLLMDENGAKTVKRYSWHKKVATIVARLGCFECGHEYASFLSFKPRIGGQVIGFCPRCGCSNANACAFVEVKSE